MDFCCGKIDLRPCDVCEFSVGKLKGGSLKWFRNEISWKSWNHNENVWGKIFCSLPRKGAFVTVISASTRRPGPGPPRSVSLLVGVVPGNWRKTPGGSAARGLAARRCTGRRVTRLSLENLLKKHPGIFHILKLFDPIARVNPRFTTLKTNMEPQQLVVLSRCFSPFPFGDIFRWTTHEFAGRFDDFSLKFEEEAPPFFPKECFFVFSMFDTRMGSCVAVFQQRMLQPFTKSKYVEMQEKPFAKSAKKYQVWRLGSTQWIYRHDSYIWTCV